MLATTDDPLDDLAAHAALAADPVFPGQVLPTFRPDAYLDPSRAGWRDAVERLGGSGYAGYLEALRARRALFIERGAVSNVKGVGEGVLEYRIDFGPGYRVYFGLDGERLVILLAGGSKRRQDEDIASAKTRWKDYKARKARAEEG